METWSSFLLVQCSVFLEGHPGAVIRKPEVVIDAVPCVFAVIRDLIHIIGVPAFCLPFLRAGGIRLFAEVQFLNIYRCPSDHCRSFRSRLRRRFRSRFGGHFSFRFRCRFLLRGLCCFCCFSSLRRLRLLCSTRFRRLGQREINRQNRIERSGNTVICRRGEAAQAPGAGV